MIVTDILIYGDRQFIHTYSTLGFMIECNGIRYDEAVDPINNCKKYTETNIPISSENNKIN